jgi:hypothetical protein
MGVKLGLSYYRKNNDLRVFENRVLRKMCGPKRQNNRRLEKIA